MLDFRRQHLLHETRNNAQRQHVITSHLRPRLRSWLFLCLATVPVINWRAWGLWHSIFCPHSPTISPCVLLRLPRCLFRIRPHKQRVSISAHLILVVACSARRTWEENVPSVFSAANEASAPDTARQTPAQPSRLLPLNPIPLSPWL